MNQLADWQEIVPETASTLEEMDQLIARYKAARTDYEDKKQVSNEAHAVYKEIEAQVIDALKANKRTKYQVDDLGTAYIISKEVYATPKSNDDKVRLFEYIAGKHGADALLGLQSINSQTLNSWANKEAEAGVMSIPGLDAPTLHESLGFKKGK